MRLYITSSFGDSKEEIEKLCSYARAAGFEDFSFIRDVENYQKVFTDPKELMKRSLEEVKKCDALLVDMTNRPTGRMIEVGQAYALGKKIIVIMKNGTEIKDTTRGVADIILEYENLEDITSGLKDFINGPKI